MTMPKHNHEGATEQANLEMIRRYYRRMNTAFAQFETVWRCSGAAATNPPKEDYKELLDEIELCAEAIGTTFTTLNMFREFPGLDQSRNVRKDR